MAKYHTTFTLQKKRGTNNLLQKERLYKKVCFIQSVQTAVGLCGVTAE